MQSDTIWCAKIFAYQRAGGVAGGRNRERVLVAVRFRIPFSQVAGTSGSAKRRKYYVLNCATVAVQLQGTAAKQQRMR